MIVSVQFSILWQQVAEILHEMLFMLIINESGVISPGKDSYLCSSNFL